MPSGSKKSRVAAKTRDSAAKTYMQDAIKYITRGIEPSNLSTVSRLRFLKGSKDAKHCQEIRRLLLGYISGNESQPFSIVVFGPPGSGKSFYVRELVASLRDEKLSDAKEEKQSAAEGSSNEEKTF